MLLRFIIQRDGGSGEGEGGGQKTKRERKEHKLTPDTHKKVFIVIGGGQKTEREKSIR